MNEITYDFYDEPEERIFAREPEEPGEGSVYESPLEKNLRLLRYCEAYHQWYVDTHRTFRIEEPEYDILF